MKNARYVMTALVASSFLGATALPTLAQQGGTSQTPKMEKSMAHAGAAKRGGNRRAMRQAFQRYDTNQDGVITQEEVDAASLERFGSIAGADGSVTLEEYTAAWIERSARPRVRAFQRLDLDGDGNVTRAEFDTASDRAFARLDRDGNGELTRQAQRTADSAGQSQRGGSNRGEGQRRMGGGRHHGGGVVALMERFDLDKDGKITRAEFDEERARSFGDTDADGSGSITLEEFATFWQDRNARRIVRGFQRLDTDGDLSVTQDEYTARSKNFVERNDRNGDGVVTRADRGGKKKAKRGHDRSMKKSSEPRKAGAQAIPVQPILPDRAIDI